MYSSNSKESTLGHGENIEDSTITRPSETKVMKLVNKWMKRNSIHN